MSTPPPYMCTRAMPRVKRKQQKVPIVKKTRGLFRSKIYYFMPELIENTLLHEVRALKTIATH